MCWHCGCRLFVFDSVWIYEFVFDWSWWFLTHTKIPEPDEK